MCEEGIIGKLLKTDCELEEYPVPIAGAAQLKDEETVFVVDVTAEEKEGIC